jgi:hypothetical protein
MESSLLREVTSLFGNDSMNGEPAFSFCEFCLNPSRKLPLAATK